jgi:hypothetical protein
MDAKKIIITTSIFAGIGAIAFGLYKFYKYQLSLAMQYCYKISRYNFNALNQDGINMDLFINIENKSDFSVTIIGYNLDILVNNNKVGTVISKTQYTLANKSITEIGLNILFNPLTSFNLTDVISLLGYALTDKSKFIIEVKGSLSGKMNFIQIKDFPIDIKMSLADILAPEDPNKPKTVCDIK